MFLLGHGVYTDIISELHLQNLGSDWSYCVLAFCFGLFYLFYVWLRVLDQADYTVNVSVHVELCLSYRIFYFITQGCLCIRCWTGAVSKTKSAASENLYFPETTFLSYEQRNLQQMFGGQVYFNVHIKIISKYVIICWLTE